MPCDHTHLAQSPQSSTCAINMHDNNLRGESLLRAESGASTLRSPRSTRSVVEPFEITAAAALSVHLLACPRPIGPLECAPRTSLRADSPQERWEGYWCLRDERYYARCVAPDGGDRWFRLADDDVTVIDADIRVLPLRPPTARHSIANRMLLVSPRRGGRAMLIGTSRRGARLRARDGGRP